MELSHVHMSFIYWSLPWLLLHICRSFVLPGLLVQSKVEDRLYPYFHDISR